MLKSRLGSSRSSTWPCDVFTGVVNDFLDSSYLEPGPKVSVMLPERYFLLEPKSIEEVTPLEEPTLD